jgi:hypothetical protein
LQQRLSMGSVLLHVVLCVSELEPVDQDLRVMVSSIVVAISARLLDAPA